MVQKIFTPSLVNQMSSLFPRKTLFATVPPSTNPHVHLKRMNSPQPAISILTKVRNQLFPERKLATNCARAYPSIAVFLTALIAEAVLNLMITIFKTISNLLLAMSTSNVDYAELIGFKSLPAAILFAILYVPLLAWFMRQSFARPTYVYIVLALFCAIRVTAFIIRAAIISSNSAGHNLSLFTADEVLSSIGFFGLLYAAYTLVLDRISISDSQPPSGPFNSLMRNKRLFRVTMIISVALGIVGVTRSENSNGFSSNGSALRKVSTVIFLILTILQAVQTAILTRMEMRGSAGYKYDNEPVGMRYGCYILCVIAGLLFVREIFTTATMGNLLRQNQEDLWYPFVALTEVVAVTMYGIPGLVPPRSELPK